MTFSELQDLVFQERGVRPSKARVQEVIDGMGSASARGQSSPGMASPGMQSPDPEASVYREPVISRSMTREAFLARFDVTILLDQADQDSTKNTD